MPDSASLQLHAIVTGAEYQPLPFAEVVGTPARVGPVKSTLIPLTVVDEELPARSAAAPGTDCDAPSCNVTGAVHPAVVMPEPSSTQVNETVTGVLFQPLPFGNGVEVSVIEGASVSMRTVIVAEAVLSARSLTDRETVVTP